MNTSLHGVRVACFYPWVAFESSGAWTRFSSLWRYLLEAGAEVTLAFPDAGTDADLRNLRVRHLGQRPVFGQEALTRWLAATPGLASCEPAAIDLLARFEPELYGRQPGFDAWIDGLVDTHDVVTCEYPMLAPLLAGPCRQRGRPLIVTVHDILHELHGKTPRSRELVQQRELAALRSADTLVFCNDAERQRFGQHGLEGVTVRNTSDVLGVPPGGHEESRAAIAAELKLAVPDYCLFVGSDFGPNIEAVAELRGLAKVVPELTFIVVGKCCAPALEGNFIALGPKPDHYLDRLHRGAFAVVVPLLHGTGASVKLFHALTYGKAVVATPVGARGYEVAHERELLIAERPADFPAALRRLAGDPALRARLEAAARAYAESRDYRREFEPYGEAILRLLDRPAAAGVAAGRRLLLVDNNLTDRIGHHFNYALSLKEQCAAAGADFGALIKRTAAADVRADLGGEAVFSQGIHEELPGNPFPEDWGALRGTFDFMQSNETFARELAAGLARGARPGDLVFLPNATARQLLGVALLLARNPVYRSLRFVALMRFSVVLATGPLAGRKPVLDKSTAEKYAIAMGAIKRVDPEGAVRYVTDSAGLAKEFESMAGGRPVGVLPIPHTLARPPAGPTPAIPPKDPKRVRLVYLGDAREEKGFELLPAIVRACAGAKKPAVEFVFQAFVSSRYHDRMAAVIEELAQLNSVPVHLVRSSLDPAGYDALLHSADLVLLPYDAVTYQVRTSGPFVEAICADKPVVVPQRSWMTAQLGDSPAGVGFVSGSPPDFVRAVQVALADLPRRQQAAAELGRRFREFHNPENFLRQLLAGK